MSTTHLHFSATPHEVFAVLADGWSYALWVVGAARIRNVDPGWPAAGSKIHHSAGAWPFLIDDTTSVVTVEPDRLLRLRARAWPAGEADVQIDIQPAPSGSRVTITENAASGPALLVPKPVQSALLRRRNLESLLRLAYLVDNRPVT